MKARHANLILPTLQCTKGAGVTRNKEYEGPGDLKLGSVKSRARLSSESTRSFTFRISRDHRLKIAAVSPLTRPRIEWLSRGLTPNTCERLGSINNLFEGSLRGRGIIARRSISLLLLSFDLPFYYQGLDLVDEGTFFPL